MGVVVVVAAEETAAVDREGVQVLLGAEDLPEVEPLEVARRL